MRRALDAARAELENLGDRDAILECYFRHASHLFQFAVMFVVRGDVAQGRNVSGLGAPFELVQRLQFSLAEPGLLARAREVRRQFVASSSGSNADETLFGSLGRAMPAALVSPLVVRDRVVAILIGDGPGDPLVKRATEGGRSPLELAKEEMLLWSESVATALERLILRRKEAGGSVPPPAGASVMPVVPRAPPAPVFERLDAIGADVYEASPAPSGGLRLGIVIPLVLLFLGLGAVGVYLLVNRRDADPEASVVPGDKIPGWPKAVEPLSALDAAKKASGLKGRVDLARVTAEVTRDGMVAFDAPPKNNEQIHLLFGLVGDATQADVRIDGAGIRGPRSRARVHAPVPPPKCSFAQVFEAAKAVGVGDGDHALLTYQMADVKGTMRPDWTVEVEGRGSARVDAETCKAATGSEVLRPPPKPLAELPGAPKLLDPIALVAIARKQSGLGDDAVLLEIEANGVLPGGHVDASSRNGSIAFVFTEPPWIPEANRRWRQVTVGQEGMPVTPNATDRLPLPVRLTGSAAPPPPKCNFANAYKATAIPPGANVRITYGPASDASGRWTIDVASESIRETVSDMVCIQLDRVGSPKK